MFFYGIYVLYCSLFTVHLHKPTFRAELSAYKIDLFVRIFKNSVEKTLIACVIVLHIRIRLFYFVACLVDSICFVLTVG